MTDTDRAFISAGLLAPYEITLPQKVRRTLVELRREIRDLHRELQELRELADAVREAQKVGVLAHTV